MRLTFPQHRFAYTELYITLVTILRRFDFQLVDTTRERDVDFFRDCFIGESHPDSTGVKVKVVARKQ